MIEEIEVAFEYDGGSTPIATRMRRRGPSAVLFLHGFGCSMQSFDAAFRCQDLAEFTLCSLDFPSHGNSGRVPAGKITLELFARVCAAVVSELGLDDPTIVGHSMGGAVGLILNRKFLPTSPIISVEGNLVRQDCGIVSRGVADQQRLNFVRHGYQDFLTMLQSSRSKDLRTWSEWYGKAEPAGLHAAAKSLVRWSDSGRLIGFFAAHDDAHYIYGSRNREGLDYLLPQLPADRRHEVPRSGHFPMLDNPEFFFELIARLVRTPAAVGSG